MHVFRTPHHDRPHAEDGSGAVTLSFRELAHELNSLLDGSMRTLRLAEAALVRTEDVDAREALERLQVARAAMDDIAAVLGRAMGSCASGVELLGTDRTLALEAERVVASLSALAERADVELTLSVEPRAGAVPAGPLGAVLMNGVRNAIEACTAGPSDIRRVETSITLGAEDDRVVIVITDTGTGLSGDPARADRNRSDGRGIGLGVCRSLVAEMGGRLALRNASNGRGAVLQVEVPRHRLEAA